MPAIRAVAMTSPFGRLPPTIASKAARLILTAPRARASRWLLGLAEMSTMRASPPGPRWVSLGARAALIVLAPAGRRGRRAAYLSAVSARQHRGRSHGHRIDRAARRVARRAGPASMTVLPAGSAAWRTARGCSRPPRSAGSAARHPIAFPAAGAGRRQSGRLGRSGRAGWPAVLGYRTVDSDSSRPRSGPRARAPAGSGSRPATDGARSTLPWRRLTGHDRM